MKEIVVSEKQAEIQNLLALVHGIGQKYEEIYTKTGLKYNIFKISQIDNKEVIMCKIIADLLNPNGLHSQGRLFLDIFLDQIEYVRIGKEERISIKTELLVDNNRRIDIVIESQKHFIPIEVKIFAGDQDMQCSDYLKYAKTKRSEKLVLYYLTLDGKEASEKSLNENDVKYVRRIAFSIHIIEWLEKCIRTKEVLSIAPIREVLQQLIRSIKNLCNIQEDEVMGDEILKEIFSDTKKIQSAIQIQQAMNSLEKSVNLWEKMNLEEEFSCIEGLENPEFGTGEVNCWTFKFKNFDVDVNCQGNKVHIWDVLNKLDLENLREITQGFFKESFCSIKEDKKGVTIDMNGNIWNLRELSDWDLSEKCLSYFFLQRDKVIECIKVLLENFSVIDGDPKILKK